MAATSKAQFQPDDARTSLFSWAGKLRMGAELFVPPRRDEHDESIGAFMTRRFGSEATTYLAEPLLAGIHAGDVNRLSVQALFPRLVTAERAFGSLLRAFRAARETAAPQTAGVFRSLPGGLSEMVNTLVRTLGPANIRMATSVDAITGHGPFTVRTSAGDAVEGRTVVLATPAYVTAPLMRERDHELASLAADIPYASSATVVLAFRRDEITHPLNGSGFVVPRVEGTGILAGSWLSSKWPHRAPADRVLLRTFIGGARDPDALDRPDEELIAHSIRALQPLIGIRGETLFARVYRWVRGSAQHEVGHLARMAAIERALARHPGLFVTGSGFRGVGIPDCVADGRATAAQVATWLRQSTLPAEGRAPR
jgi:oxygen-dependent protoporphyrinogen oxidase